MIRDLLIQTGEGEKGRSFRASLLASVEADNLWALGAADTETRRPVLFMVACSDQEAAPFAANLRTGKTAEVIGGTAGWSGRRNKGDRYELLRSGGYQYSTQRHAEGVVITAFLPDLFRTDPGMVDPAIARFVMVPDVHWCADPQSAALSHVLSLPPPPASPFGTERDRAEALEKDLPALCRIAPLFAAYLDRRTRAPLIPDVRFYAQILIAAVRAGYAARAGYGGYIESGLETVGLLPGLSFQANHEELEALLSAEVRMFDYVTRRKAA